MTQVSLLTRDEAGTVPPDQTIMVDAAGRLEQVGPATDLEVPAGYRQIQAAGRHAMPGLVNVHAHLFSDGRPLAKFLLRPGAHRHFVNDVLLQAQTGGTL